MKRLLFLLLLVLGLNASELFAYSHIIDVNIYNGTGLKEITITIISGSYSFESETCLFTLEKNATATLTAEGKKIILKAQGQTSSHGLKFLNIKSTTNEGVIQIKPAGKYRIRSYDDNLTVSNINGALRIINNIDIEKYVAGVVEAEVGMLKNKEFYKVQAVACRTYVLNNIRRHMEEDFNVCDKEHCQVYNGKCRTEEIMSAVEDTRYFVIIDKDLNFISAVFHSNCGGQTVNSENVWSLPSTYLKSIRDTFCLKSKNAFWEYRIKKQDFLSYLSKTFQFPIEDTVMIEKACNFKQLSERKVYFLDMTPIHLKLLRNDLKLKSTFFSIYDEGETLVFKGRGFGHGVGLCQEGAMEMINQGFSYDEIIKHYYTNVYIVSYEDILKLNK